MQESKRVMEIAGNEQHVWSVVQYGSYSIGGASEFPSQPDVNLEPI